MSSYVDTERTCVVCGGLAAKRVYTPPQIARGDIKFDPHFSVGLGQPVRSAREVRAICKDKGLVELGNEKPKAINKAPRKPQWDDYAAAAQKLGLQEEGREDLAILKEELQKAQGQRKVGTVSAKWEKSNAQPIKVDVTRAKQGLT